jgi:hypothetical protein
MLTLDIGFGDGDRDGRSAQTFEVKDIKMCLLYRA